jgi:hypothetical protein
MVSVDSAIFVQRMAGELSKICNNAGEGKKQTVSRLGPHRKSVNISAFVPFSWLLAILYDGKRKGLMFVSHLPPDAADNLQPMD